MQELHIQINCGIVDLDIGDNILGLRSMLKSITVKKDETVWFRMCPKDETGGYYEKMSNLKVTMFTQ